MPLTIMICGQRVAIWQMGGTGPVTITFMAGVISLELKPRAGGDRSD